MYLFRPYWHKPGELTMIAEKTPHRRLLLARDSEALSQGEGSKSESIDWIPVQIHLGHKGSTVNCFDKTAGNWHVDLRLIEGMGHSTLGCGTMRLRSMSTGHKEK
jgi:hypothetical protein